MKHLVQKTDPAYPSMGKQLHVQGEVKIQIAVSEAGQVKILKIISGSPILASAAIEAVTQWHYAPFILEGRPVAVQTIATVPFSLGDTPERIRERNEKNDLFFTAYRLCRKQIDDQQLSQAEVTCKKALTTAEELDPGPNLAHMDALGAMGNVFFLERKFPEALSYYQAELRIGETILKATDGELAAVYHNVGNGLWGTGQLQQADLQYEKAESSYKQAAAHIESSFIKNEYAKGLKSVLHDHAVMLRQMDRPAQAENLEKESSTIVIKEGLKDN
ncbi:MAG TPA: TonB family protein [Candidatus Angelobacter sp.]|nr:TonB family protein [Candidatus Angelobacter sp.]